MIRNYLINLLFKKEGIFDSENNNWVIIGNDYNFDKISELDKTERLKLRSLYLYNDNTYLYNNDTFDFTFNKKYTISLKYTIPSVYLFKAISLSKIIHSLKWNDKNEIRVLDNDNKSIYNTCIRVILNDNNIVVPFDYNTMINDTNIHIVLEVYNNIVKIFVNGNLLIDKYFENIDYILKDFTLGNYKRDYKESNEILSIKGPQIYYDEFCLSDDIIFDKSFETFKFPLHYYYPESDYNEENNIDIKKEKVLFSSPWYYNNTKSKQDIIIESLEIERSNNYKQSDYAKFKRISKYKFD